MTEECTLEFEGSGLARLAGALTFDTCADVYLAMQQSGSAAANLECIDLSGVTHADSAGLALLLEWQSERRATGGELAMSGAPESLLQLARLCNAVDLLKLTGREA